ncbi:hypothetical protein JCM6882_009722 [Rhodosporidiobolus microsporus]
MPPTLPPLESPPPATASLLPLLPSLATSPSSPTTTPVPGVLWRRSRSAPLVVLFAALLLAGWIAAALVLFAKQLFLPLDFFGGVSSAGDKGITNGTYNTLITLLANLVLALVAYALSLGLRAALLRAFLSPSGVSLNTYDALVKASHLALQTRLRWSALGVAAVFVVAQLFGPGTQAVFGTSVAVVNISAPYPLLRLSSNLAGLSLTPTLLPTLASGLPSSQDTDFNLKALWSDPSIDPNSTVKPTAMVLQVQEFNARGEGLFAATYLMNRALGVEAGGSGDGGNATANFRPFSGRERRLLDASPDVRVYATVEAFFANATCDELPATGVDAVRFTHSFLRDEGNAANSANLSLYEFDFACGTATGVYSTTSPSSGGSGGESPTVVDTYACPFSSSTPSIYVFSLLPSRGTLSFAYRCTLSTSSALLPIELVTQLRLAHSVGPPVARSRVELPDSLPVVAALGAETLNTFGLQGFSALAEGLDGVELAGLERRAYVERVVEALAKGMLARVQHFLVEQGTVTGEFVRLLGLEWEEGEAKYQLQSLKLHPTAPQLAWLLPPLLLLLLLLLPLLFLFLPLVLLTPGGADGAADFTDPVAVALIGLGSGSERREEKDAVRGACTGAWAKTERGKGGRERAVRLVYGAAVPLDEPGGEEKDGRAASHAHGGEVGVGHLEMRATTVRSGRGREELGPVVEGREYA